MANVKNCPDCGKEVSKSAKACPNCGKKLKMGFFMKAIIALVGIIALVIIAQPSSEEKKKAADAKWQEFMSAVPEPISSSGELQEMFSMGSNFTGLQRENKEKELEGKIVQWNLEVYEVNQRGDKYRIQFSGDKTVGAFATITPQLFT